MPGRVLLILTVNFSMLMISCMTDNIVDSWEAQTRVNNAYFLKLDQCKQQSFFFLFVPNDQQDSDVRRCEGELLASGCPMKNMPASCVLLMIKKAPHKDIDH